MRRGATRTDWPLVTLWVALQACAAAPPPAPPPQPQPGTWFSDVTLASGLPSGADACLALRDFDHDGRTDLLTANAEETPGLHFLRNEGGGRFTSRVSPLGLVRVHQCAAADLDADGHDDLLAVGDAPGHPNVVRWFRGDGQGGFTRREEPALDGLSDAVWAVAVLDADADGHLDVAVGRHPLRNDTFPSRCALTNDDLTCTWTETPPSHPGVLLMGRAGGGFLAGQELAGEANVNVAAALDLDRDGWTDLFLSREFGKNAFLRNARGRLEAHDLGSPVGLDNFGMGVGAGDFDGDGLTDLYVADMGPDQLHRGLPGGLFALASEAFGVVAATRAHSGWNPIAEDFDLDGRDDLFVAQAIDAARSSDLFGAPADPAYPQTDLLYVGGEGFRIERVAHRTGARDIGIAAAAAADLDGDGRLEVAVSFAPDKVLGMRTVGAALRVPELRVMHNGAGVGRHWLTARVQDHGREAVGAVVETLDAPVPMRRYVGLGSVGAAWDRVHFGLGARTSVRLRVTWVGGAGVKHGPFEADRDVTIQRP